MQGAGGCTTTSDQASSLRHTSDHQAVKGRVVLAACVDMSLDLVAGQLCRHAGMAGMAWHGSSREGSSLTSSGPAWEV